MKKQALCMPPAASASVEAVPSGSTTAMRLPFSMSMAAPVVEVRLRLLSTTVLLNSPSMKNEPLADVPESV